MSTPLADVLSDKPLTPQPIADEEPETPEAKPEGDKPEGEKPADAPADAPAPEAEKPAEDAQPREPSGKFAKTVPLEALHEERRKRQELEARIAGSEKKPKSSVFEDEDKAFNERLSEAVAPVRSQFFELTIELAKEKPGRENYDDIYQFMNEECAKHPEIVSQIVNARNPGEEIYRLGKTRKELAEVGGDITKFRDHITAKSREELKQSKERIKALEAEVAAMKASQEKRAKLPQSLNAEPSGAVKDDVFAGPTPLKKIFSN